VHELYRLMTMSVGDLLDEWFEHDALKGCIASTGVVGVWAGPRTPGTAYNLLHHELGALDGAGGAWGHVRGGMGAISLALARAAEAHGATVRTGATVASIDVAGGAVTGVTLADGAPLRAPLVVSGAHPQTTVLELTGAEHFPDEVVTDMRRYRTRGAAVKVNLVLSEPPRYSGAGADEQHMLLHTGVALGASVDTLERAWQEAVLGRPATVPYIEVEVPSAVDPTLADGDGCVMTMFTQYGPHDEAGWPDGSREAYLRACLDVLEAVAPGVADHAARRGPRPARPRADLRAARRVDLPRRAGPRPARLHAPDARSRPLRNAGPRPVPVRRRDASGRRGDGRIGPQRGDARPARPAARDAEGPPAPARLTGPPRTPAPPA
jgi:phytoene dehydrogenase-like protein